MSSIFTNKKKLLIATSSVITLLATIEVEAGRKGKSEAAAASQGKPEAVADGQGKPGFFKNLFKSSSKKPTLDSDPDISTTMSSFMQRTQVAAKKDNDVRQGFADQAAQRVEQNILVPTPRPAAAFSGTPNNLGKIGDPYDSDEEVTAISIPASPQKPFSSSPQKGAQPMADLGSPVKSDVSTKSLTDTQSKAFKRVVEAATKGGYNVPTVESWLPQHLAIMEKFQQKKAAGSKPHQQSFIDGQWEVIFQQSAAQVPAPQPFQPQDLNMGMKQQRDSRLNTRSDDLAPLTPGKKDDLGFSSLDETALHTSGSASSTPKSGDGKSSNFEAMRASQGLNINVSPTGDIQQPAPGHLMIDPMIEYREKSGDGSDSDDSGHSQLLPQSPQSPQSPEPSESVSHLQRQEVNVLQQQQIVNTSAESKANSVGVSLAANSEESEEEVEWFIDPNVLDENYATDMQKVKEAQEAQKAQQTAAALAAASQTSAPAAVSASQASTSSPLQAPTARIEEPVLSPEDSYKSLASSKEIASYVSEAAVKAFDNIVNGNFVEKPASTLSTSTQKDSPTSIINYTITEAIAESDFMQYAKEYEVSAEDTKALKQEFTELVAKEVAQLKEKPTVEQMQDIIERAVEQASEHAMTKVTTALAGTVTASASEQVVGAMNNLGSISNNVLGSVNQNMAIRVANLTAGIAAGDDTIMANKGVWVSGIIGSSEQRATKEVGAHKGSMGGGSVGFDITTEDDNIFGVSYSHVKSNMKDAKQAKNKAAVKTNAVSLYMQYGINPNLYLRNILSYAMSEIEIDNLRNFRQKAENAKGKLRNNSVSADVALLYRAALNEKVSLLPTIGLRYNHFQDSGYKEKLADKYKLALTKRNGNQLAAVVGATLEGNYFVGETKVKPSIRASLSKNIITKSKGATAEFVIADKVITQQLAGNKDRALAYDVGLGLAIACRDNLEFGVDYNYHHKQKFQAHQGSLKLRVNL